MNSRKINFGFLLLTISCSMNLYSQDGEQYKVASIDSTAKNYLILVQKLGHNYMIISPMVNVEMNHDKLTIGKEYRFLLLENSLQNITEPEISNTISIDEKKIWEKGDNFDVVFCNDLKGLYYVRNCVNKSKD